MRIVPSTAFQITAKDPAGVVLRRAASAAAGRALPPRHLYQALALLVAAACMSPTPTPAQALTPAFTYQGELRSAGSPANASFDMEFRLYSTPSGSGQIGPLLTRLAVPVTNGLFSVPLDFGAAQFAGDRQWLEIAIRPAGGGAYETLSPRTEVTAAPYAWSAAVALANSVSTTSLVDGAVQSADIAGGAVGTTQINPAQVQRRVSGTCAGTQGVQSVNADGTVLCGNFAGTVTSIATGAGLTGGPITASGTISVAPGGIGTTEINAAQVQRRVGGSCAGVGRMTAISEAGGVTCVPDLDTGVDTVNVSGGLTRTLAGRTLNLGTDSSIQRRTAGSALSCPAGQVLQAVAADGTPSCVLAWLASGNAGLNATLNYLGTSDATPLNLRSNNVQIGRIESLALPGPAGGATANVQFGNPENLIAVGVRGATISGGGARSGDSEPDLTLEGPNRVRGHYGTVGGGYSNTVGAPGSTPLDAAFATIAGGRGNSASEIDSFIGGGSNNFASGQNAVVGGGFGNSASLSSSVVGGGDRNTASGAAATVGGGFFNCAGGHFSWAGGSNAKVRPGSASGAPGVGCNGVASSGDADGDQGSFVWADVGGPFVSSGANQFLVRASGGFGFNTNDPLTNFDIVGQRIGHVALIRNEGNTSPDGLAVRLNVAVNPTTANNFLTFQRADGSSVGSVEGNGAGGVVFNTSGGDYAEYLPLADGVSKAALTPGRVVGIRGGRVSLDTDGAEQLGVVSTNPAISGNDPGEAKRDSHALIAFLGQVDVVVAGPVNAGDFLIASGHADGRAIAVPPDRLRPELLGEVLGRAWTASAEGSVRALVGLSPVDAAQSVALAGQAAEIAALRAELAQRDAALQAALSAIEARLNRTAQP